MTDMREILEHTAQREAMFELRRKACVGRLELLAANGHCPPPEINGALELMRSNDSAPLSPLLTMLQEIVRLRMEASELRLTRAQWKTLEMGLNQPASGGADPTVFAAQSAMVEQLAAIDADIAMHGERLSSLRRSLDAHDPALAEELWKQTGAGTHLASSLALLRRDPAEAQYASSASLLASAPSASSAPSQYVSGETNAEHLLRVRSEAADAVHRRAIAVAQLCLSQRCTLVEERQRAASKEGALRSELRAVEQRCAVLEGAAAALGPQQSEAASVTAEAGAEALRAALADATASAAAAAEAHAALEKSERALSAMHLDIQTAAEAHAAKYAELHLHHEEAVQHSDELEERAREAEEALLKRDATEARIREKASALARQCAEACERANAFESAAQQARHEQEALAATARQEIAALLREKAVGSVQIEGLESEVARLAEQSANVEAELKCAVEKSNQLECALAAAVASAAEQRDAAEKAEANESLAYSSSQAMHRVMLNQSEKLRLSDERHQDRDHHAQRAEVALAQMRKFCHNLEQRMLAAQALNTKDLEAAQEQVSELLAREAAQVRELDAAAAMRERLEVELKEALTQGDTARSGLAKTSEERDVCLGELAQARVAAALRATELASAHERFCATKVRLGVEVESAMRELLDG